ncbi:hypothetical protein C7E17_27365, partial [Stenotrophomonas maltophilia]
STLTLGGTVDSTFSGAISGNGGLVKNGAGVQTLGGSTLTLGGTVDSTFSGAISGNGGLVKNGAGVQT